MSSLKALRFENWIGIFLCLFASSLLFSISVMELFATILLIFCIWGLAKKRISVAKQEWTLYGVGYILGSLFLWTALSLIMNGKSLAKLMDLRWIFWIYLFFLCLIKANIKAERFKWLSIPILLSTIYAVIFFLSPYEPLRGPEFTVHNIGKYLRTGGFLGSPMTFANVIAPMFCFSIVVSFYYWKESLVGKKWVLLSCLGLGLSLLLTFTRGAWVGAFVGALLILGFYSWRWVVALIVTASVMGATLFYLSPEFQSRFTSIAEVNNSANMGRQALWKAHIEMIKDHPLFGVGYGAAKSNLDLYYDRLSIPQDTVKSHAHNQLLHFAAGMGIPGVFLLLSLWIYLLFFNWKLLMRIPKTQVWHRSLAVGLLGAQVCFYILSQTEATLEDSEVGYTWTLLIGLLFCVYYLTKPREINKIA